MEKIRIQTASGLLIASMIDDNVPEILEDQNNQIMEMNEKIGIASKVYLF